MHNRQRERPKKADVTMIAQVVIPFFVGCGVMLFLFKVLPREFGLLGTLVVPTTLIVYGSLITVTGLFAITRNFTFFSVDVFLLTLLASRYYMFHDSISGWILCGGMLIMVVRFMGFYYIFMRLKGELPTQQAKRAEELHGSEREN